MIIYNAEDQILGRLSSVIAKQLLKGEKVFVVNVEKAVLSGNEKMKIEEYKQKRERGDPIHGPFFPKEPDGIFLRTVRGMIPWDRSRGREAFKNLKVFIGMPEEFKDKKMEKIENADASKLKVKYTYLGEIATALGSKKKW